MKAKLYTLGAVLGAATSALASPLLELEISFTEQPVLSSATTAKMSPVSVESGEEASVSIQNLRYDFTPTLNEDGTVTIEGAFVLGKADKEDYLKMSPITTELGEEAKFDFKNLSVTAITKLAEKP